MALLTTAEIQEKLLLRPKWTLTSNEGAANEMIREYEFPGFAQAMKFVNRVASLAEAADHHPDIDIRYNKVTLSLTSHDAGGLTARDFKLAAAIDALQLDPV